MNFFQGNHPTPYGFSTGPYYNYTYNLYKAASTEISYTVPLPSLHLDSIDINGFASGDNQLTTLRGTGLFGSAGSSQSVQVSGNDVTARVRSNQVPNTAEVLDIVLDVAQNAERGERQLTLTVGGVTSNALTIMIGDNSPQITGMTPPEGNAGETIPVTISGNHFGFNPQIQIIGTDISATPTHSTTSEITAVFSVADAAIAGQRGVRVRSLGYTGTGFQQVPGTSDLSNITNFAIFKPIVTLSEINLVQKGGNKNVTLKIEGAKSNTYTYISLESLSNGAGNAVFLNNTTGFAIYGNTNGVLTIKGIEVSSQIDKYQLKVATDGTSPKTDLFTVFDVQFKKASNCSGFDDVETPNPYLFVPQNGSNQAKVSIVPNGLTFNLSSVEQNGVQVSPNSVSGEQPISVTANSNIGEFTIQAVENGSNQPLANKLKVVVRKRINKTVIIHAVTEDNDDVQTIPIGQGEPNQIAIEPSASVLLTTVTGGDDQRIVKPNNPRGIKSYVITTGANGIRETVMVNGDVEIIPINQGKPNSLCVAFGTNGERDTNVATGDEVSADDQINSGANGLCETIANNTDIVPPESSIPNATALQDYLNNTTWGKQANIFFTVTRDATARQVNFDLDRDGVFNISKPIRVNEYMKISDSIPNNGVDTQLFYTGINFQSDFANAETIPPDFIFFSPNHNGTINYLAAHELGHSLTPSTDANTVHSPNTTDLMYYLDSTSSPCAIRKRDWDLLNIDNSQFYSNEIGEHNYEK